MSNGQWRGLELWRKTVPHWWASSRETSWTKAHSSCSRCGQITGISGPQNDADGLRLPPVGWKVTCRKLWQAGADICRLVNISVFWPRDALQRWAQIEEDVGGRPQLATRCCCSSPRDWQTKAWTSILTLSAESAGRIDHSWQSW